MVSADQELIRDPGNLFQTFSIPTSGRSARISHDPRRTSDRDHGKAGWSPDM